MKFFLVDELNQFVYEKNLRKYQDLIIDKEDFSISIDGKEYEFVRCKVSGDSNILYLKRDALLYFIESQQAGTAYLLTELVKVFEVKSHDDSNIERYEFNDCCVVMGHWNFAHFIWNHLSAFYFKGRKKRLNYCVIRDPIADPVSIMGLNSTRISEQDVNLFRNNIFIGGLYIVDDVCRNLIEFLSKDSLAGIVTEKKDNIKNIYLGVRGPGVRELENEVDFYAQLIPFLSNYFDKKVFFYIDGFSFTQGNHLVPQFTLRNQGVLERIANIISRVDGCNVQNISGLQLLDTWEYIKSIDFYVTHEGTMQHKIGWVYRDKPGTIITGSQHPRATALWHANQIENGLPPLTLDINYIHLQEGGDRNSSFKIKDIPSACEEIANHIEKNIL